MSPTETQPPISPADRDLHSANDRARARVWDLRVRVTEGQRTTSRRGFAGGPMAGSVQAGANCSAGLYSPPPAHPASQGTAKSWEKVGDKTWGTADSAPLVLPQLSHYWTFHALDLPPIALHRISTFEGWASDLALPRCPLHAFRDIKLPFVEPSPSASSAASEQSSLNQPSRWPGFEGRPIRCTSLSSRG